MSASEREGDKQINRERERERERERRQADRVHGFVLMTFSSSFLSLFYFLILRVLTTVLVLFVFRAEPLNANSSDDIIPL